MLFQNIPDLRQVRTLGDRTGHVSIVVKQRKPGAQAVLRTPDILRIDPVAVQLLDDVRADAAMIHNTDKGRLQFHVRNVLRHIPADSAVHLNHPPGISPARKVLRGRISLDVDEDCSHNHNSEMFFHRLIPSASFRAVWLAFLMHSVPSVRSDCLSCVLTASSCALTASSCALFFLLLVPAPVHLGEATLGGLKETPVHAGSRFIHGTDRDVK